MTDRRRRQPKTWKTWVAITLIVILALALVSSLGFLGYKWYDSRNNPPTTPGNSETETVASKDVSPDTMERLDAGTILVFGEASTPRVTLFVDPSELSRTKTMVGGSPSDFFNAIKDRELSVNLYLPASTPERNQTVDAVLKVAICLYGNDTTATKLPTLLKISDVADKLRGNENLDTVASLMGLGADTQCAADSTQVATDTSNNVVHFMTQFQIDQGSNALIAGNSLITDLDLLRSDWSELASKGTSAKALLTTGG